jgi:hypothetical protein
MPERVYMNRITGEERIHVEITAAEIDGLLEDLAEASLGRTSAGEALYRLLEEAAVALGVQSRWIRPWRSIPDLQAPGCPDTGSAATGAATGRDGISTPGPAAAAPARHAGECGTSL